MSDIKQFRLINGKATELQGKAADLENPNKPLIERSMS